MYNSTIIIENIDKAREFVTKMNKYPDTKITLKSGNYSIDGHSIIGVISLDISKPIELVADGNVSESFINEVQLYAV